MTKPFSPRELRARIRALLRRSAPEETARFSFGECEADFARKTLRRGGAEMVLTAIEWKMLRNFVENRGRLLSRDQVIESVWGVGMHLTDRVVDTHIVKLRRKIGDDPAAPRHIVSVRGLGYRFEG